MPKLHKWFRSALNTVEALDKKCLKTTPFPKPQAQIKKKMNKLIESD